MDYYGPTSVACLY